MHLCEYSVKYIKVTKADFEKQPAGKMLGKRELLTLGGFPEMRETSALTFFRDAYGTELSIHLFACSRTYTYCVLGFELNCAEQEFESSNLLATPSCYC